jgi:hypothetical protein
MTNQILLALAQHTRIVPLLDIPIPARVRRHFPIRNSIP